MSRAPIRLSHSTNSTYKRCERRFEHIKLRQTPNEREDSEHLGFGTAFGVGLQTWLQSGDLGRAFLDAYLHFNIDWEKRDGTKSLANCLIAIEELAETFPTAEWELAHDLDNPCELGIKIILDSETGDYYCGFIDAVLRNKYTGQFAVLEAKTTGDNSHDLTPAYQNSGQGIGYSVVLDNIQPGASFTTLYAVAQIYKNQVVPHYFPFHRTILDRLDWLVTLKMDYEDLRRKLDAHYFPMRGDACKSFGRPCPFFGICNLHTTQQEPYYWEDDKADFKWDFTFHIEDLIQTTASYVFGAGAQAQTQDREDLT